MRKRLFLFLFTIMILLGPAGVCAPPHPDFSGTWKQSNERCAPKRTGNVIRHIDQRGSGLVVETAIVPSSGPLRHAVQHYSTDGRTAVSIGPDGDEFHTSIAWNGQSMVFSVEEHEDHRVLYSRETWTLIESGSALRIDREDLDVPGDKPPMKTLIYLRQSPGPQQSVIHP